MAVIKFYIAKDNKLIGTVTSTEDSLTGDTIGVQEMVNEWRKSPDEFTTAYSDWGNGYLYSREEEIDKPSGS